MPGCPGPLWWESGLIDAVAPISLYRTAARFKRFISENGVDHKSLQGIEATTYLLESREFKRSCKTVLSL